MTDQMTQDLFETPDRWPMPLQRVIEAHYTGDVPLSYEQCREFCKAVEAIGFTFDFGLEGVPCNLRVV